MEERIIPNTGGKYRIMVTDDDIECIGPRSIVKKDVANQLQMLWRVDNRSVSAERLVKATFPEMTKSEYIPKLYKGVKNKPRTRTFSFDIVPGVRLTALYQASVFLVETPVEPDVEKDIKRMFPGMTINVIEGVSGNYHREIYFTSSDYVLTIKQKIIDFFSTSL